MRKLDSMAKPFWALGIIALSLLLLSQWFASGNAKPDDAILASGMTPQVELVREIAAENGWKVTCVGRTRRMTVLRIVPGLLPWKASHDEIWDELVHISTSLSNAPRISLESGCDLPASTYESTWTDPEKKAIIGVGPIEELEPLLAIARECEVRGARLTEGPPTQQNFYSGDVPEDWVGLEVDPRLNLETGPFSCLVQLANREFSASEAIE